MEPLKVGDLVMKISGFEASPGVKQMHVPCGAVGEIIEWFDYPLESGGRGGWLVLFALHRSTWRNGEVWMCPSSLLRITPPPTMIKTEKEETV